ncbi:hypothetical protein CH379_016075 [Leptospira ellisii]|uniref:DUF2269 family protein n=1 Tax=Leptospira ellisii TaxID=2023197 RepID=A0A2N0BQP7_9LEPT|nr:hypothetical protein [Leptospira ellisii]MDV6237150.1 hypothetical protein [Leptospira ellisii]PJZ93438.1 hypothetical protein CH379_07815 [Leptospira ellisii]PKA06312.1 hypothetical protein CH375_00295 [Leptospira ellisii]
METNLLYFFILKLVHVSSGIFWVGAAIMMAAFVQPTAKSLGPDGGKFMQQLARTNAYPIVINTASTLTILSGFLLYWKLSGGFQSEWIFSKYGTLLLIGGILAVVAYGIGFTVTRPSISRMAEIGIALQQKGPSPDLLAQMPILGNRIALSTRFIASLIGISVLIMEMARYL